MEPNLESSISGLVPPAPDPSPLTKSDESELLDDEATSVINELDKWYDDFYSEEALRQVNLTYLFSPEWDQLHQPGWEEYDALAERQRAMGAPRLDWQDEEDEDRELFAQQRAESFNPMKPHLWPMCPLWVHLRRYQGIAETDRRPSSYGWNSLADDWAETRRLARDDPAFFDSLSPAHKRSLEVLRSWWIAAYCDPELLDTTVDFLEESRFERTSYDPAEKQSMLECAADTQIDTSLYHSQLYQLLLVEFHPHCWEPYMCGEKLFRLQSTRYVSCRLAAQQKLAYAILHPGPPEPYSAVVMSDYGHPAMTEAQFNHRPYYLWDVDANKTVRVSDLPECPEYTCVSHTWGRWRTRTNTEVPGVPWPVPENTRYDVRDLPEQLRGINSRFVWLDLFCIPQSKTSEIAKIEIAHQSAIFKRSHHCIAWINDVDSWEGVLRALDWLSLRALWMTCKRDRDIIAQLMPAATKAAAATPANLYRELKPELCFWFSSLWTLQEAILCPNTELHTRTWGRLEDRRGSPIPLQTLMVVLSETCRYLRMEEPPAITTAFPDAFILAVANHPSTTLQDDPSLSKFPMAVRNMAQFWMQSNLEVVLTMGPPVDVFMNADKRTCTSSRAPAIMSALGITDWYLPSELGNGSQHLVFGKYPLEFLREAAAKLGAIFFFSSSTSLSRAGGRRRQIRSLRCAVSTGKRSKNASGGLLPVSQIRGRSNALLPSFEQFFIDREDHESVATWIINETGSVTLPAVGIVVSSSSSAPSGEIQGQIRYITDDASVYGRFKRHIDKTYDMQQSLKNISRSSRAIHAVALFSDLGIVRGVLLEECDVSYSVCGREYLKKIGEFRAVDTPLPPTSKVDWTVL